MSIRNDVGMMTIIDDVIQKHTASKHAVDGGNGICCYVWVNGECVAGSNSLDLTGGFEKELREVNGVHTVKIKID